MPGIDGTTRTCNATPARMADDLALRIDDYNRSDAMLMLAMAMEPQDAGALAVDVHDAFARLLRHEPGSHSDAAAFVTFLQERFLTNEEVTPAIKRDVARRIASLAGPPIAVQLAR